jgi:hypothetical protein
MRRPNILIILTDQHRRDALGAISAAADRWSRILMFIHNQA